MPTRRRPTRRSRSIAGSTSSRATGPSRCWWCRCARRRARRSARCDTGAYGELKFREDEMMELRYASLLHDFGKVGVREQVLVKAKKLYPADLERIRHRVELLKRDLALRASRAKLDRALARGADYAAHAARLDADLAVALAELDRQLDLVGVANEPSVQAQAFTAE